MGWELEDVEKPFVAQLQALGWAHTEGNLDTPALTGRSSFSEVIQEGVLRERLRALNPGPDGQPWLDDARLSEAVAAITRLGTHKLMEANRKATETLIRGLTVEGLPGWDGGRGQTIRYIDWDTPANNRFTVVNQYRVDCPPGFNSAKAFIVPDLVLLVNGIPLVVAECKSPSIPEPLAEAVDQLRRYSNQRKAAFEIDDNEGNEALFATNQLLVATSFDEARVGSVGSAFEHFAQWKTVVGPDGTGSEIEVAERLSKPSLSEQERLIAGMLTPVHLLDVVKHFLLFMQVGGQTIKSVCRYQQYRAVNRAIARLKTGQTRLQHGEHDQRGGIIWHTQGSGKSLTMVFLVRKMRAEAQLRRFKVIVVTDRKDLQTQLSVTATLTGEVVEVADSTAGVKALARRKGPGLIFATIQKYRDTDTAGDAPLTVDDLPKAKEPKAGYKAGEATSNGAFAKANAFEVLNEDDGILVLVDEAHRTQAGDLHANLLAGLPNCARIGFTGTPIIMAEKDRLQRQVPRKAFVGGEGFLYLGRSHRLKLVDAQDAPLKLAGGRFCLRHDALPGAREHFIRWYSERAKAWLSSRVADYQSRMEVRPAGVKVQDLGYRWGSCGKGDWLYFHWKAILLPARIAEYVVVHEIAHLHEPHHTPAFWRRVERTMPDYAQRKAWLAEHGIDVEGI